MRFHPWAKRKAPITLGRGWSSPSKQIDSIVRIHDGRKLTRREGVNLAASAANDLESVWKEVYVEKR
jgi:hypothetical protein